MPLFLLLFFNTLCIILFSPFSLFSHVCLFLSYLSPLLSLPLVSLVLSSSLLILSSSLTLSCLFPPLLLCLILSNFRLSRSLLLFLPLSSLLLSTSLSPPPPFLVSSSSSLSPPLPLSLSSPPPSLPPAGRGSAARQRAVGNDGAEHYAAHGHF